MLQHTFFLVITALIGLAQWSSASVLPTLSLTPRLPAKERRENSRPIPTATPDNYPSYRAAINIFVDAPSHPELHGVGIQTCEPDIGREAPMKAREDGTEGSFDAFRWYLCADKDRLAYPWVYEDSYYYIGYEDYIKWIYNDPSAYAPMAVSAQPLGPPYNYTNQTYLPLPTNRMFIGFLTDPVFDDKIVDFWGESRIGIDSDLSVYLWKTVKDQYQPVPKYSWWICNSFVIDAEDKKMTLKRLFTAGQIEYHKTDLDRCTAVKLRAEVLQVFDPAVPWFAHVPLDMEDWGEKPRTGPFVSELWPQKPTDFKLHQEAMNVVVDAPDYPHLDGATVTPCQPQISITTNLQQETNNSATAGPGNFYVDALPMWVCVENTTDPFPFIFLDQRFRPEQDNRTEWSSWSIYPEAFNDTADTAFNLDHRLTNVSSAQSSKPCDEQPGTTAARPNYPTNGLFLGKMYDAFYAREWRGIRAGFAMNGSMYAWPADYRFEDEPDRPRYDWAVCEYTYNNQTMRELMPPGSERVLEEMKNIAKPCTPIRLRRQAIQGFDLAMAQALVESLPLDSTRYMDQLWDTFMDDHGALEKQGITSFEDYLKSLGLPAHWGMNK